MRLLLFNPETEYALASGASFYTPPARVAALRREMQLLPEAWAQPDDIILVDEPGALMSRFRIVGWSDLASLFKELPQLEVEPWGWNPALIRRLLDSGVPSDRMPDEQQMALIRALAHRRTTIAVNTMWNDEVPTEWKVDVPVELRSIGECMTFLKETPGCWMKAPWSSSGRGVINTAADMTDVLVEQWCRGILRRQGSVMGETPAVRNGDFATEWILENGKARFLGLSCFSTSNRGKYLSNESIPQQEMKTRFDTLSNVGYEELIPLQRKILEQVLGGYSGPCGVDIILEQSGRVRPFVEINLRRTMGMLGLR